MSRLDINKKFASKPMKNFVYFYGSSFVEERIGAAKIKKKSTKKLRKKYSRFQ